jgi:hypothetical protein
MQLRPWLAIIAPEPHTPFVAGEKLHAKMRVHNTGNSHATITRHCIIRYVVPSTIPSDAVIAGFQREPTRLTALTHVPAQRPADLEVDLEPIGEQEIKLIEGNEAILYIFARLEYSDALGRSDTASFYFEWDVEKKRLYTTGGDDSGRRTKSGKPAN